MATALLIAWAQVPAPVAEPSAWAAFRHTWTTITGYSTTVTLFERKGARVQNSMFAYTFTKPRVIVDIARASGLPMRIYGYEGATLMRQVDFANVKVQR